MAKTKDTNEDQPAGDAPAKKGLVGKIKGALKNKKILFGAIGLVVILLGAGGYFAFAGGHKPATEEMAAGEHGSAPAGEAGGEHGEHAAPHEDVVQYVDLPDMTVNLASTAPKPQFLKVRVTLEVPSAAVSAQIQPLMPRIQDIFQVYLRELRATDIEGSAGIQRLKEELTRRVNQTVAPAEVTSILFKEMLVQ